jgi:hypothetical protein
MKIGLIIPWREQPSRIKAFKKVCEWYQDNLPEAKVYLVDNGNETWEMSATRNLGVRLAEQDNCDVIIINDADTIPQIGPLREAINDAFKDNMIHNPYTIYTLFDKSETELHLEKGVPLNKLKCSVFADVACSGTIVFTPKAWWDLGGNDEKFIKWGYEDTAQNLVHFVIHGTKIVKHTGTVFAFSHEVQDRLEKPSEQLLKNRSLYKRYLAVSKGMNPKENILALVKSKE